LWQPEELLACATSFGAYCLLNYLVRYGCPFGRIALRCPAIDMYTLLTGTILTPLELEKLEKGKPAEAGFDRLIRITPEFLEELRRADLHQMDFLPWAEQILILHGTKDEIVPIGSVESFADEQLMEFEPVENADHRFQDPKIMDLAISRILKFYFE
jgi:alpha-beta hydrolase superfamily lysophospholipase